MIFVPDVDRAVDAAALVEDIAAALRARKHVLPRRALEFGGVWFAPMAAYVEGMGIGAKLVGIYPGGRPPVRALAVLIDPHSGEPLALADATRLTGWRTAAASALAARLLGASVDVVGVVGAGVQAEYHIRVFREVFKPSRIVVYSRSRAAELASRLGVEAAGIDEVLRADVVIAATDSREPVVRGASLRPGSLVVSVGAPRPVRELDDAVRARARCAVVDSPEAPEETDDVAGLELVLLEDLVSGRAACRKGEISLYKSVGYAPFDVAAIYHVYRRAREAGLGVQLVSS
ncbi:MAG: ornithine cyclodeaminase family protein [Thermoproteus sp.]